MLQDSKFFKVIFCFYLYNITQTNSNYRDYACNGQGDFFRLCLVELVSSGMCGIGFDSTEIGYSHVVSAVDVGIIYLKEVGHGRTYYWLSWL